MRGVLRKNVFGFCLRQVFVLWEGGASFFLIKESMRVFGV